MYFQNIEGSSRELYVRNIQAHSLRLKVMLLKNYYTILFDASGNWITKSLLKWWAKMMMIQLGIEELRDV